MSIGLFATHIRLEKASDWPLWIGYIKLQAAQAGVWHIIDPDETHVSECQLHLTLSSTRSSPIDTKRPGINGLR